MPLYQRTPKQVSFKLDTGEDLNAQIQSWVMENNADDPEPIYSLAPDGVSYEDVDPAWTLTLTCYADWRADGISEFAHVNDGLNAAFVLVHHPESTTDAVHWTGTVRMKAPSIEVTARETETFEWTLQIIGEPVFTRGAPVVAP